MQGMTEQLAPSSEEARREEAATWLVRLEAGDATEADWLAFENWLGDAANKRELDAIEAAMADIEDHPGAFTQTTTARPKVVQFGSGKNLWRTTLVALAAAAAAAVIVLQLTPPPTQQIAYAAPSSGPRTIVLPDASQITLNRGAAVLVRWSKRERRIELERGEAAFAVRHNTSSPFIVTAGAGTIRDLGTEFNVLRERNGLRVTVRSGSVDIRAREGSATLSPGEQASISDGRLTLRQVNAEDALAWRDGRLIYHNASLPEVIADLNRYSATPISVGDSGVASLHFSGVLIIDEPTAMTARLEAFLPLRSEQDEQGIVLRSR